MPYAACAHDLFIESVHVSHTAAHIQAALYSICYDTHLLVRRLLLLLLLLLPLLAMLQATPRVQPLT
jgi:hypothetical protein